MKKFFYLSVLLFLLSSLGFSQLKIATAYNYPPSDSILTGLKSIRGMYYADDPFGDGHSAMLLTNYELNGFVHLFVTVGNDSIALVWTSPYLTSGGGSSTPRFALLGDLDNDGLVEIIYQSNNNGIYIYEWDGVAGSYNFGTEPSQVISSSTLADVAGNVEYMEINDIDGDGVNELIVTYNGSTNNGDITYIISASGEWNTGDPGFSGFTVEKEFVRTDLAAWGISGGTPYSAISAQLDGTGNKEILLHNWNHKNVVPVRVPSADTYQISDTTNGKQNIMLGGADDDVALFAGIAYDIDGDGRDEIYLPTYNSPLNHKGWLHMIHYEQGQSTAEIDTSNVFLLDMSSVLPTSGFGAGYGDLDGNGKPNIYVSGPYPYNLVSAEFQGGEKTDPNNWVYSVVYPGEDDIYTAIDIKDSAGTIDTVKHVQTAFASKFWSQNTDFDKDGKEDILLPYQALNDSVDVVNMTYNSGTGAFDTTSATKYENPKRWGFRILESTGATGISAKDLTIITPDNYKLDQNYPNPFNPSTNIRFTMPLNNRITLKVYDILGNEVKTLLNNKDMQKGSHEVVWDGTNNYNQKVASGQYICTFKYGNFAKSIKMTLLK